MKKKILIIGSVTVGLLVIAAVVLLAVTFGGMLAIPEEFEIEGIRIVKEGFDTTLEGRRAIVLCACTVYGVEAFPLLDTSAAKQLHSEAELMELREICHTTSEKAKAERDSPAR